MAAAKDAVAAELSKWEETKAGLDAEIVQAGKAAAAVPALDIDTDPGNTDCRRSPEAPEEAEVDRVDPEALAAQAAQGPGAPKMDERSIFLLKTGIPNVDFRRFLINITFFFVSEKFSDKETKFNTLPPLDRILSSFSIVPA